MFRRIRSLMFVPVKRVDRAAPVQQRKADVGYIRETIQFGGFPGILKMIAGLRMLPQYMRNHDGKVSKLY